MLRAVHGPTDSHFTVYRPAKAAVRDVVDSLLALKAPTRDGFCPKAETTHVSIFFSESDSGVINVTYTSRLRRLLCYCARFENGDLVAVMVAGHSVRQALADGAMRDAVLQIQEATARRGAIREHRITSIAPPEAWSHRSGALARFFAAKELSIPVARAGSLWREAPPPMSFNKVNLAGWFSSSFRIPSCTFSTSADGRDLLLLVRWGAAREDTDVINLCRPREAVAAGEVPAR